MKTYKSDNYNYIFNSANGFFARWGKTLEDNPQYAPSPELIDIEISEICNNNCRHCYKSNTKVGRNMSFNTFKLIFDKLPKTINQIALGIGDIYSNSEIFDIFKYCRDNNVVPNVTINGSNMTPYFYDKLVELCGAVAVSLYDIDTCYNAVKELTDRGMKQINIHALVSFETEPICYTVLRDSKTDERLKKLNAIVLLRLKPKGLRNNYIQLSKDRFKILIEYALKNDIRFGMDSCSAPILLEIINENPEYKHLETLIEPCEANCFSMYINVEGVAYPCSFTEDENIKGVDVLKCKDFTKEVWNNSIIKDFRERLINNKRECIVFNLK